MAQRRYCRIWVRAQETSVSRATALAFAGFGREAIVTTVGGVPTTIRGNPPQRLGAGDAWLEASLNELHDSSRARPVLEGNAPSTWNRFWQAAWADLDSHRASLGARLRILTGTVTSPSLAHHLGSLLAAFPEARWHVFEPVHLAAAHLGARMAFGTVVDTHYRFDRAAIVVALDSDFLLADPGSWSHSNAFMSRRENRHLDPAMAAMEANRLHAIETVPTLTGAIADRKLPLGPHAVEGAARALAAAVGVPAVALAGESPGVADWVEAVAEDLLGHRGAGIVIAGRDQAPVVHALAQAMNVWLQNTNATVYHTAPIAFSPTEPPCQLADLVADMAAGAVDSLYILAADPAGAPAASRDFAAALAKVRTTVHLGLRDSETAALCQWRLPMSHELEAWADIRSHDGTVSLVGPIVAPLSDTRSPLEVAAALATTSETCGEAIVRGYWKGSSRSVDFDSFWERTLCDGRMVGTAEPTVMVRLRPQLAFGPPRSASKRAATAWRSSLPEGRTGRAGTSRNRRGTL